MKKIALVVIITCLTFLMGFIKDSNKNVTGKITDETGAAVSGASVVVKGTARGVATDMNGYYRIMAKKGEVLIVSAVGLEEKVIKIGKDSVYNITLAKSQSELESVVVTGYSLQRKSKSVGYATAKISTSNQGYYSQQNAAPSILMRGAASISGRVPGVNVTAQKSYANGLYVDSIYNDIDFNTEDYDHITENNFKSTSLDPLSTFSIDVDAASYSNIRRYLNSGQLPPAGAVRIEEMINYFHYDYPQPLAGKPFSVNTEVAICPWNQDHKLALIGIQGKKIVAENLPASNIVFLIDVSGSMQDENKLPLLKSSLKLLVDNLREQDKIAMVVYAGSAGVVLNATSGANKTTIKAALDKLEAGGSTAGGAGIKLAYKIAKDNFIKAGNNRVILCTDGDFNVGASSDDALETMIENERKSNIFLTVLGYGMGNYKDNKMQKLADKGNGNHAYIDNISEARKVLVNEFGGTLFTIAKDVKLQIEFNPNTIQGYRLIGYENRMLNKEDFNDDKKDAGELGSGHTVTAIYEIIPAGIKAAELKDVDALKYQSMVPVDETTEIKLSTELINVKLRYKNPDGDTSMLITQPVITNKLKISMASENLRFAAAVAGFGMLLRNSAYKGNYNFDKVMQLAQDALGKDKEGYRSEFLTLVEKAAELKTVAIK